MIQFPEQIEYLRAIKLFREATQNRRSFSDTEAEGGQRELPRAKNCVHLSSIAASGSQHDSEGPTRTTEIIPSTV